MPRRAPAKKAHLPQAAADHDPSSPGAPSSHAAALLFPQANPRDPESNWEVDLAKNLEEYLLKICSGELSPEDHVNFAEAALVLQGSVQVYSRKVEYLYTLVLHALDFIAHKTSSVVPEGQDNQEGSSDQPDAPEKRARIDDDEDVFFGLDDVPEDPKNSLDSGSSRVDLFNSYVKPPANLVVLEGECLDTTGEAGELESYLLSTCNFHGDFLLLDPCDARAVQDFMRTGKETGVEQNASCRGSSIRSKTRNPFSSPGRRSGGSRQRPSIGKRIDCLNGLPAVDLDSGVGYGDGWCQPDAEQHHSPDTEAEPNVGSFDAGEFSDDEDPWKPLNPHEPGCLKVKPYKKVMVLRRKSSHQTKLSRMASEFPVAKLDGIISPEFTAVIGWLQKAQNTAKPPQSIPFFEKLRKSLHVEEYENLAADDDTDGINNEACGDFPDFEYGGFDIPENMLPAVNEMPSDYENISTQVRTTSQVDVPGPSEIDNPDQDTSLEDLCRAHLDSLLASIAETEKQTELASRVSSWKQRIEHSLEEEDSHMPFDIHLYGERVLAKLSSSGDIHSCLCFGDIVCGLEKREIARTFSAMLQLVNNGNIELVRDQFKHKSHCFTSSNPFTVKLIDRSRRREIQVGSTKKRLRSPLGKGCCVAKSTVSPSIQSPLKNGIQSIRPSKVRGLSSSPNSKRRRPSHSQAVRPVAIRLDR